MQDDVGLGFDLLIFVPAPWVKQAACRGVNPDLFFPEKGESAREAKKVCAGCPVRQQCLDMAISNGERHGIFGGMNRIERAVYKRKQEQGVPTPKPMRTIPHGTNRGYQLHYRAGETPCVMCTVAHSKVCNRRTYRERGEG